MLAGEHSALIALAITFIWSMVGTNTIIFLTGMATLDPTLTEAARVDGLSRRADLLPGHAAAADQVHPVLVRDHGDQRVLRAVQPDLRDDQRGAGLRHHDAGVLHLPAGFQQVQFGTAALYGVVLFVIMAIAGLVQLRLIKPDDGGGW